MISSNVQYETTAHIISTEITKHRTFMDTTGRTKLKLTALNVVDEMRSRDVTVSSPVTDILTRTTH